MASEDWYRNTSWDSKIETEFEARLKRSRGAYNKAQYLRIQAGYLLYNPYKNIQLVGLRLMKRLIKEFPAEEPDTIFGQEQLGDYYFKNGDFVNAEKYFRIVTDCFKNGKSRSGTSWLADLKLAEAILITNQTDKFEEAYNICKSYPVNELNLNSDRFYYFKLMAQLCYAMNKKEAKDYAKKAIEISKINTPQFSRHKTVGLVKVNNKQLLALEEIANEF